MYNKELSDFYDMLGYAGIELIKIVIGEKHSGKELSETLFNKYKTEDLSDHDLAMYIYRKYICREIGI